MASQDQSSYIADLVVLKVKEFKEVRELLVSSQIVGADAQIVKNAQSINEITNALTEQQASRFIDVLLATKDPARGREYSKRRIEQASATLDDIKGTIAEWDF